MYVVQGGVRARGGGRWRGDDARYGVVVRCVGDERLVDRFDEPTSFRHDNDDDASIIKEVVVPERGWGVPEDGHLCVRGDKDQGEKEVG